MPPRFILEWRTTPKYPQMPTEPVDPAIIGVWRCQGAIATVVILIPSLVFALAHDDVAWFLIPIAIALAGSALTWGWPPLYYRHLQYGVDDAGIVIQRGVLWRSRIALPRVRIQHTDVSQGPLQRRFGVGTLKLYTAGSSHTKIELEGLRHAEAIALRDALLAGSGASGV